MNEIGITAFGLTTSVGRDARTTAASIRAGLSRRSDATHMEVLSLDGTAGVPPKGSAISGVTDGYSGYARWAKMLDLVINDLQLSYSSVMRSDPAFWEDCEVFLLLPEIVSSRYIADPVCNVDLVQRYFVNPVLAKFNAALSSTKPHFVVDGHTGLATALQQINALFQAQQCKRALLIAVDSYLDFPSMEWLIGENRLKTDEQQHGLIPGEAAAAMFLEPISSVSGLPYVAQIGNVEVAEVDTDDIIAERDHGRALARCMARCIGSKAAEIAEVYLDLNGEYWRAYEYGAAKSQLPPELLAFNVEHYPSSSAGDTGAVSPLLASILTIRSYARNYSVGDRSMIISMSDSGEVAAFQVSRST